MAEINWNLLDPNSPAKVAASFDLVDAWNKGQANALAIKGAKQHEQMNALAMQKAQRVEDEAPMVQARLQQEADAKQQTAQIEHEIKMQTIRANSANIVASAPEGMAFQAYVNEAKKNALLLGQDPTPAIQHAQQVMAQGGEGMLRQEAQQHALDAKSKLQAATQAAQQAVQMRGQDISASTARAGQAVTMRGQDMTNARLAEANKLSQSGGTPYFTPIQTGEGIVSFDNRKGSASRLLVDNQPVVGSVSDPQLQGELHEAGKTGTEIGVHNIEQYKAAEKAPNHIKDLDRLLTNLNTSESITGLGADVFKNIERAKTLLGSKAAAGKVKDTELLDTMMGSAVFPMISSLGIGARGMDTPAEREFMRSVLTGSISLNKETLVEMTNIRKRIEKRSMEKWNKRVDNGELDRFFNATGIPKGYIEMTPDVPAEITHPNFPGFSIKK